MADEATVEIVIKARQQGTEAIKDVAQSLGDVRTRMAEIQALGFWQEMGKLLAPLNGVWQGIQNVSSSITGAVPLLGSFMTSLGQIPVIGPIILVILAALTLAIGYTLAAALAAFILVGTGVVTVLTAMVAGFAAIAVAATVAFGPLALMAGAVLLLADRMFTTGQTAVDPLLKLEKAWGSVADTWGRIALPIANQITEALIKMLPAIQSAGIQMIGWFGEQLPRILPLVSDLTRRLSDEFNRAWPFIASVLDQLIGRGPQIGPAFSQAMNVALDAAKGLFNNLMAFIDWFTKEWPKLEPIVKQVMDQAGKAVQGFAAEAKRLVDWFVANWPQITELARNLEPVLVKLGQAIELIARAFVALALSYNDAVKGFNVIKGAVTDLNGAVQDLAANLAALFARIPGMGQLAQQIARAGTSAATNTTASDVGAGGRQTASIGGRSTSLNVTMYISGGDSTQIAAEVDRRLGQLLTAT